MLLQNREPWRADAASQLSIRSSRFVGQKKLL
jgi:hypothetical protein